MELINIIEDFEPVAIKMDDNDSVLIEDKNSKLKFWIDIWEDKDGTINWDWNQYIFIMTDPEHVKRKAIQENLDVADGASSIAIEYYENNKK